METELDALARTLDCAHVILHAPSMFAHRVRPATNVADATAINKLVQQLLWPMALDSIKHNVMNRVRLNPKADVVRFRILVCPLDPDKHSLGFVAALRTHRQDAFEVADLPRLQAATTALRQSLTARLDPATGLLVRPAFEAEVALRGGGSDGSCLVYANLDRVHVANELSGFEAGDQLIRAVGRFWQQRLVSIASVATHLSGDRFAAVLFGHTLNQARHWADQTREGIEKLADGANRVTVTASFGIAAVEGKNSLQHSLAAAETACRVAKERGRNRVELYVTGDHTVMRRHEEVRESRVILDALDQGRLVLFAQPIVTFGKASPPTHFEVLLRVQGADGKLSSIAGFLDAAERYQLLERIDRWVIARILRDLAPAAASLRAVGASFAVNITGQSLSQPDFADFVRAEIKTNKIPAGMLDFELTETAAVRNLNATRRFIARMLELGARVALDDFGTGLSSLMHLKDLDIHRIKIDGKFVRDVLTNARSRALIRALVQIAGEIGLETVAEFVESEQIATGVRELGVQCAQGYHYARPQPLALALSSMLQALRNHQRRPVVAQPQLAAG